MHPLRLLTWHVHGNYLYYLSFIPHIIYLPVNEDRSGDYRGKGNGFPWPATVVEVPVEDIPRLELDCILFQRPEHYLMDQNRILSRKQRQLPRIFLEHDPPQEHPTNTSHCIQDPSIVVVHVTHFNRLMWDNGPSPTVVIPHGVVVRKDITYQGDRAEGIVVVNHLARRGRRLGADIYDQVKQRVPVTLIGMASEESGGIGEIGHDTLNEFVSHYRFFFNPIRYTSLGLAVCEAMMVGLPIVGLATTEMPMTIHNGISGYVSTRLEELIAVMKRLIAERGEAARLGRGAQAYARRHFNINRFVDDWKRVLQLTVERRLTDMSGATIEERGGP